MFAHFEHILTFIWDIKKWEHHHYISFYVSSNNFKKIDWIVKIYVFAHFEHVLQVVWNYWKIKNIIILLNISFINISQKIRKIECSKTKFWLNTHFLLTLSMFLDGRKTASNWKTTVLIKINLKLLHHLNY